MPYARGSYDPLPRLRSRMADPVECSDMGRAGVDRLGAGGDVSAYYNEVDPYAAQGE